MAELSANAIRVPAPMYTKGFGVLQLWGPMSKGFGVLQLRGPMSKGVRSCSLKFACGPL